MPLKLTITSYQRLSPGQEATKILERGSISIGRAAKNDWVLQDPERILSSEHCVVYFKDGGYVLTDTSTNGTFLNDSDQRIPRNQTIPLKSGDRFVLGEYEIEAAISAFGEETFGEGPSTDIVMNPILAPADVKMPDKMASPSGGASLDIVKSPFDLLAESRHNLGLDHLDHPPEPHRPGSIATEPPVDIGGPEGAAYQPPDLLIPEPPEPSPPQDDLQEPIPESPAPPFLPISEETPAEPPLPEPVTPPESEVQIVIPDDWWQAPAPPTPEAPPLALEPPFAPPFEEPAPPPPAAPKPPTSLPTPVAPIVAEPQPVGLDAQALLHAFLNGAGLPSVRLTDDQWRETMASLGAIFRETVQGLMEILLARGDLKGEFRLDRTAIGPVENNPLKTPPGQPPLRVEEVMVLLLASQKGAYMSPVQAVREGFNDIKAHHLAVMAGIQAALIRLLERFDPDNLETRLEQNVFDNLWPANRKAKYWDLFNAEYQAIAREAEDDFNELFGDEFARAYEEHLHSR